MTIHYSGMTRDAQDRIAEGATEMLDAHLDGRPLASEFVMVDPAS